jgi:predicted RNA binding protein YcfA (HicA-like mRNA interferase family)
MKLPQVSGETCVKVLKRAGFHFERQKGSHVVLLRNNPKARVVVPLHGTLKKGTLHQILMDSDLKLEDFLNLL